MKKVYTVQWDYQSNLGGPWAAGEAIELFETRAADINRDSPGVLVEAGLAEEKLIPKARDRMVRRAQHRGQGGSQKPIDTTTYKAVKDKG